ncbi:Cell morphogenesis protein PAG1, partial [Kappamyces sp. JEL0680]
KKPVLETQLQKLILRQTFAQFIKAAERKLAELDFDSTDRDKDLSLPIQELVANFILCRALIAIIQNLGSVPFSPNLGARLEKMIFDQLVVADPENNARFVNIGANFDFFSKLMGTLSEVRLVPCE